MSILTGLIVTDSEKVKIEVDQALYGVVGPIDAYKGQDVLAFWLDRKDVGDEDLAFGYAVFKEPLISVKDEYMTPEEMGQKFPELNSGKIVKVKVSEVVVAGSFENVLKYEFKIDTTQFQKATLSGAKATTLLTFDVKGSFTTHKARTSIILAFNDGKKPKLNVTLEDKNGEDAFVIKMPGIEGTGGEIMTNNIDDLTLLAKAIRMFGKIEGKVLSSDKTTYKLVVELDAEEAESVKTGVKIQTTDEIKKSLVENGASQVTLGEIEVYLISQNIDNALVKRVFKAHKKYPEEYSQYISKKPKTAYIDNQGLLARVINYTLGGTSLRLHGDASTGKNVLLDTLSWIFQKPLFQKPVSSQIDKFDIFGAKGFESRVDDNGNQINEVMFQKELLIQAMEVGGFYNLDEVNLGPSEVLELLNPVLDYRKAVDVSGFRRVVAAEGFNAFATMNPSTYTGTRDLNEAFASRFGTIRFRPNTEIKAILEVHDRCEGVSHGNLEVIEQVYQKLYSLAKEEDLVDAKVLSLRLYAEAAHYSENPHVGMKDALIDNVAGILDDDDQYQAVVDAIDAIVG